MKKVNLAKYDTGKKANDGVDIELMHPVTGEPLGAYVILKGIDSEEYRKYMNEQTEKRLEKVQKEGKNYKPSSEEFLENSIELLARLTIGWKNTCIEDQELAEKETLENRRKIYRKFAWLREQADRAIADRANFMPS